MERNGLADADSRGGGRPLRVKDVAARAGVSVGTVSNVLNGRKTVAPDYVDRVMQAVKELGFLPNDAARTLRAGSSRVIGFVIAEQDNPVYTDVVRGAEEEAEHSGGIVLIGHSRRKHDREAFYLGAFAAQRARGVVIQPYGDVAAELGRLRSQGTPTVVLDAGRSGWGGSSISMDGEEGGRLAARHLVEVGRRRLAFVGGPLDFLAVEQRVRGARAGAEGVVPIEAFEIPDMTIEEGHGVGSQIALRPAGERPDGIFAGNDLVALGLLNAFTQAGIRVPDDISIVGYDDIGLAATAWVPLTSIRQPREETGAAAVRIIDEERREDLPARHLQLRPELVIRASSWPGRSAANS
ncbi:LacI family DNA-binding transcriptional regulator [Streptomyces sp. 110]|uniref:LacI family DNA-binding transcriptional regulator n=1 Tax=Streptomyces endocoffeicus TaxID=2898945 RepID=A0ABS1Q1T3_9ACTN|nr:LacI family DNA-binding transcriptional regulator [Streptomyces endocoffeicus]MBL1118210.1 LacI family DNA-binding transcriptional regulator [Streptomyces endocoffeicus]